MEFIKCNICGSDNNKLMIKKDGYNIVKCKICNLVYVNPQPSQKECINLYSDAENYFPDSTNSSSKSVDTNNDSRLKSIIKYSKNGRILDIGCGTGSFLRMARNHGFDVFGIEPSKDMADSLKKRYNLDITDKGFEHTDFPDEYFDVITMWDVLEHVNNPILYLNKINKVLKSGGVLFLSTPNIDGLEPKLTYYTMGKLFNFWRHPEPPWHIYQFSKDTIKKLLNKADFEVTDLQLEEIPISYLAPLKSKKKNIFILFSFRMVCGFIYLLTRLTTREYNSMIVVAKKKSKPTDNPQISGGAPLLVKE